MRYKEEILHKKGSGALEQMPREFVDALPLDMFMSRLDGALGSVDL